MRSCSILIALVTVMASVFVVSSCRSREKTEDTMMPPTAKRIDKSLKVHGDERSDPYYWLNDREDPEVLAYLAAENEYTDSMLADTREFQDKLFNEIIRRIEQSDVSVPYNLNGYEYYYRYSEGAEYPQYFRKKLQDGAEEELILDVPALAENHAFYHVTGLSISPDRRYLAYGVDKVSRRQYEIHIRDLNTGHDLEDIMVNTTGHAVWAADSRTLFYTVKDSSLRPYRIMRHTMGSAEEDVRVYEESDATFIAEVGISKSRDFILIASTSTLSDEYRVLSADDPEGEFAIFQRRERGLEYRIDHANGEFYILTNWEAVNFRLMKCSPSLTSKGAWEEVIAGRDDVLLEDMQLFRRFLVLNERRDGLVQFRIIPWDGGEEHYLEFWEETYYASFSSNFEIESDILRFEYSSLTTPNSTYDYKLGDRELTLRKRQKVLGDFSPENYHAERLSFTSHDGVEVPVSLVYRPDLFDGSKPAPAIIYGYGSYGYSLDPYFSSARLSLLDRGFVFAMAHVRGGQEKGRRWYEDGKLLKKRNTFLDFIACSEGLIQKGFTTPDHLYAIGGSAGGLLVGAVVNMRPDLYHGIVAQVPFVDVVTTMLDESIPLTTGEFDEWGNPSEKEYYDYMMSYSPYDNVEALEYPAMLVTTGLYDSQVQYWEPAKWVARMRTMKAGSNLLLLHTDMETGHGGASGRFKAYRDVARYYAFLFKLEGIRE